MMAADRFTARGRDVLDTERPGWIAGFGDPGRGTSAKHAAELLNAGAIPPEFYEWWPEKVTA